MAGLIQDISLIGDEIPWLNDLRRKGKELFEIQGIPNAKTEAWKYTKPRELSADDFVISSVISSEINNIELPFATYTIYFENGRYCQAKSNLPPQIKVLPLLDAIKNDSSLGVYLGKGADASKYPFAALNQYYLNEGVVIQIPDNTELDKPLAIISHTIPEKQNLLFNLRNLFLVGANASATVVEYHTATGEVKSRYFANIVNEIYLASGAKLNHYKVQDEAYKADHIALNAVNVAADAFYNAFCLQRGANIGRNETLVKLNEKGASAELNGAYLMNGWATLDTTNEVRHISPYTTSNQLVKGVIGGDAKGIFQSKIHIAPNAVKTEGYQLHKAMLLSDTAEIDVKPELEIYADDTKCSHGAASGELDEEQLFYMRSRGIGLEEAKQILIDAYLEEVIALIKDDSIGKWIKALAQSDKIKQVSNV